MVIATTRVSMPMAQFTMWLTVAWLAGVALGPVLRWLLRRRRR